MRYPSRRLIRDVKILDCTLRDGGHLTNWNFDFDFAAKVASALAETNIHCMEVGYVSSKGSFPEKTGRWRFSREEDIRKIIPTDIQSKISVMGDIGKVGLTEFKPKNESIIDVVRLAFYKGGAQEAIDLGHKLLDMDYEVYLNLMGIVSYNEEELKELLDLLYNCKVANIVVSDSFGSLMPWEVKELVNLFKSTGKNIGYHAHNNLEMAFANSIAAIEAGARTIDATIYGMGRGAGNLPLEVMLGYLLHLEDVYTNIIPLLELIESDFIKLKKELKWGYNLHYMISGLLKCHPKYASKLLEEYKMDMPSVWANLVEISKKKPISFNKTILENVTQNTISVQLKDIKKLSDINYSSINSGQSNLKNPDYVNRHTGKDFLVLGNGPSLKENIDQIKKFVDENKLIVLGANYLHNLIIPDYHAFNNLDRFLRYGTFSDSKSRLLIGSYISDSVIRMVTNRDYERLPYVNSPDHFDIKENIIQSNCGTISILLIATAIIMGARQIYVAGLDGYKKIYGKNSTFYTETHDVPTAMESYSLNEVCEQYLHEITTYQIKNNLVPFKIITKTSYSKYYGGGLL